MYKIQYYNHRNVPLSDLEELIATEALARDIAERRCYDYTEDHLPHHYEIWKFIDDNRRSH